MKFEEKEYFTFDDVLIKPLFSSVKSRKDVNISSPNLFGCQSSLTLPIFSANMDTITGVDMAKAMTKAGGMGVLHRFFSVEENVEAFKQSGDIAVSVGLGDVELERAIALIDAGAKYIFIDVAHGATEEAAKQLEKIKVFNKEVWICVGNFASKQAVEAFLQVSKVEPNAIKVGVGPGSACTTRIKTGVGVPQLSAILECREATQLPIIADGGMKNPGDIAKALAAGASAVMLGGMLSGTQETPGEVFFKDQRVPNPWFTDGIPMTETKMFKKYRGSASKESYEVQGKDASWRTAEGESFIVPYKGPVAGILQDIEGGLRSSFAYVGATNLQEFQEKAIFISVSASSIRENGAHGKI